MRLEKPRKLRLGRMSYGLFATPAFAKRWFPQGVTPAAVFQTPALIFNRKDRLHAKLFQQAFKEVPSPIPTHYIPSSEKFADFIAIGAGGEPACLALAVSGDHAYVQGGAGLSVIDASTAIFSSFTRRR